MPDLADALRAGVPCIGVVGYPPFQHVGYLLDKEMGNASYDEGGQHGSFPDSQHMARIVTFCG